MVVGVIAVVLIVGSVVALTTVLTGLPLGYHRDLQEDKEPLFDAADTLVDSAAALAGCVETLSFDTEGSDSH